ncbi:MAG: hypothetical protein FOGNACKC_06179 [Anaerolineae bacterium]|nr:hypothetical protein [Anaerolineae bacterium]
MEVKILNVISERDSKNCIVDFATQFGSGRAEWFGSPPHLLYSYGVEFSIEEELVWGDSIIQVEKEQYAIDYQDEFIILRGRLESIDADGNADIRIGHSILMIVTVGSPPAQDALVQIRSKKPVLYPHDEYGLMPLDSSYQQSWTPQLESVFSSTTYKEFLERYGRIRLEYSRLYNLHLQYEPQERRDSPESKQMDLLKDQSNQMLQEYIRRLPVHFVAQCPYCNSPILQPVDSFSLIGFYPLINISDFYHSSEAWTANLPPPRQCCRHAIVATLSVNLNGLIPDDLPTWALNRKWGKLHSAPRVMVWPLIARQTSAVIHALPIGRLDDPEPIHRYTAYFVTYFANGTTNLYTEDMWVPTDVERPATEGVLYDPDLAKWVRAGRLFWLDPNDPTRLIRDPAESFPYTNIQPQGWYEIVEKGQINGPHAYYKTWQGDAPLHDESLPQTIE